MDPSGFVFRTVAYLEADVTSIPFFKELHWNTTGRGALTLQENDCV